MPTVSTSVGAEGLDLVDGRDLLIGDEPAEFAACVVKLLDDRSFGDDLRRRGREAVVRGYSWQSVGERLQASFESVRTQ